MLSLTPVDVAALAPGAFLLGLVVGLALSSRYTLTRRNGK